MKYRHEYKYFISEKEIEIEKSKISAIMSLDTHTGNSGQYTIRSLYFDNYSDRCYYENENGTDPREKFRIRIYNGSSERITLECKRKERGKTLKTSCLITEEQCLMLMKGVVPKDIGKEQTVLSKLSILMKTELFRPKVIVEYDRIPYVYRIGNVRVTFDINIRTSNDISHFLCSTIPARPILQSGQHILEVKFDELLPDTVKSVLEIGMLSQTAFSKYYLCRKLNYGGIL